MLRAWRRRSTYDPARGSAQSWLLAIVADQARQARAKSGRDAARGAGPSSVPVDTVAADGGRLPAVYLRAADVDLDRAVQTLPDRQRLAVVLYYFLDLPIVEVAGAMDCAEGTVRATLVAARSKLRDALGEFTPEGHTS